MTTIRRRVTEKEGCTDQDDPDDDPGPEEERDDEVKDVVHPASVKHKIQAAL